nr:MAG TPA: hypothetical protein [Caudoviricetes sp.]
MINVGAYLFSSSLFVVYIPKFFYIKAISSGLKSAKY